MSLPLEFQSEAIKVRISADLVKGVKAVGEHGRGSTGT